MRWLAYKAMPKNKQKNWMFPSSDFPEQPPFLENKEASKCPMCGSSASVSMPEPLFSQRLVPNLIARIKELEAELELHRMRVG